MSVEAMKQALDALESIDAAVPLHVVKQAIKNLREALAQPAARKAGCTLCGHCAATGERVTAQRQPLTTERLEAMAEAHVTNCYFDTLAFARAIEAAHGMKEKP